MYFVVLSIVSFSLYVRTRLSICISYLTISFFLHVVYLNVFYPLPSTLYCRNGIIGLKQAQSGGVYDPADVQIVNRPNGATTIESKDTGVQTGQQFAGRAQPKFVPAADPGFFFDGQCTASAGNGATGITAHTCTLNLCLGGGGYNCLALYCGSAFIFNPAKVPGNTFKNAPVLPPAYPCAIIGGTNVFQGARGSVDVTTLTGRTSPVNEGLQFGFITQRLNVISNKPLPPAP